MTPGLAHFANPVPHGRLGTADNLGNIVQRLSPVLLQLHEDFSIEFIHSDRHSTFLLSLEQNRPK